LFGGLNYNVEVFVDSLRHNIFDNKFNYNKVLDIRQGKTFTYLPQSKVEVEKIVGLITKSLDKCNVSAIVSNQGTESAFNSYCTNGSNILHLATHGFYLKKDSTERKQTQLSFKFKNLGFKSTISKEDDAMERSGLLLSGGNFAIKNRNNYIPHEQDGILTASEIYYKNIPNLELVVLSACDTGLGEVCGEGVYGLQRAFKKAGANSILMSLWEVDDFATQMLMVEFYKHFLNGETKTKSLLKAQQYVKSQQGFEDPEYWAGFVLLDGLN
jgi:CHAT domain-containing protein